MLNLDENSKKELIQLLSDNIKAPLQQEIDSLKTELKRTKDIMNYDRVLRHYDHIMLNLQKKKKLKVAFFAICSDTAWKYDTIYKKMVADDYFEPMIFICPRINCGDELMLKDLKQSFDYFKDSDYDYNVINTYNEEDGTFLDIESYYSPDIVFFSNPWRLTKEEYYIDYWAKRALTCHNLYGVNTTNLGHFHYDDNFHNQLWRYFIESDIHREMSLKHSRIHSYNTEVTGFCFLDELSDPHKQCKDGWKTTGLKRIIWAPHHLGINLSNFKEYSSFMLQLVEDYKDKIEIAFRPHPLLIANLYDDPEWGKARTDEYYAKWDTLSNGQLMVGNYIDYFFTSDALILDSVSFMTDYLYTTKPSLFTVKDDVTADNFNQYGKVVLDLLYKSYSKEDTIKFIDDIVINGNDHRQAERQAFLDKYFNISKSGSIAQDILDHIKRAINPQ